MMSAEKHVCDLCGRNARYHFAVAAPVEAKRCTRHAIFYPPVRGRALQVAALVGTILFGINQAEVVLTGHLTALVAFKSVLTYVVPFSVSTYSALQINRLRGDDNGV